MNPDALGEVPLPLDQDGPNTLPIGQTDGNEYQETFENTAVVLVHGYMGSAGSFSSDGKLFDAYGHPCRRYNMEYPNESVFLQAHPDPSCLPLMGRLLQSAGFQVAQPFDYRDRSPANRQWTMERLAGELHKHLECVLNGDCIFPKGTRVERVDVVAHSIGGLIARAYIAGLAVDAKNRDAPIPYDGRIRKLVLVGSPNFGTVLGTVFDATMGRVIPHAEEVNFGSELIFRLHEARAPVENLLVIVGTRDDGMFESDSDGVVNIASAALPAEVLPRRKIRYVPYRHAEPHIIPPLRGRTLIGVDNETHCTYLLISAFLGDRSAPRVCDAYKPPREILGKGLLLVRLLHQGRPIMPAWPTPIWVDGSPVTSFVNPDTGAITIWPLAEGKHTVRIRDPLGFKVTQQPEALMIQGGYPTVLPGVEVSEAADLVVTWITGVFSCVRAGKSQRFLFEVWNRGRLPSKPVRVVFYLSALNVEPLERFLVGEYNLDTLDPGGKALNGVKLNFPLDLPRGEEVSLVAAMDGTGDVSEGEKRKFSLSSPVCKYW